MHSPGAGAADKTEAPYGSWESPITAAAVSAAGRTVEGLAVAGDGRLVWVEKRPEEGGASVLVREATDPGGKAVDVTPREFAVRTLAQEYGGGSGAFAVQGDTVVFSNYDDQRLYRQTIGDRSPFPLTPEYSGPVVRYADGVFDPHFPRYVTVMEDHRNKSLNHVTTITAVTISDQDTNEPTVLVSGNDFYAFPRIDPSQKRMAWIEWSNPDMPWDKSQLWVGELQKRICIAGGDPTLVESPTEPKWSSKGELFFITDRQSGFWNIYKWDERSNVVIQLYALDAEFSKPIQNGRSYVGVLDHDLGTFSTLDIPFSSVTNIVTGDGCFYIEGASATLPVSIAKVNLDEKGTVATNFSIVWSSSEDVTKYKSYFSLPEFIEFPTAIPGQHACAIFYAPYNPSFQGSSDEKPPLLVRTHGGPTDEERGVLDLNVQYWTSRGFDDSQVVPSDQTKQIYKAMKDRGLPVALVEYEGEPHGFRKADNIKFTLEQQMVFFARTVGQFKVADEITPIKIENFD
ncbi:hypothetical protein PR202_gb17512 [Eleusine coracana subsp. coracana]|uniref:Peptidase S9 prolyl oligopeptidase catalytic domain-containing protein n=1 Tax=Eleusine coracana subsp. coracana TaxID=191504 RepID=A0AAV5F4X7_ELECO|nr:hypothetical protein PR202_gb17512 [Eleusine coracana subsp. coracana]